MTYFFHENNLILMNLLTSLILKIFWLLMNQINSLLSWYWKRTDCRNINRIARFLTAMTGGEYEIEESRKKNFFEIFIFLYILQKNLESFIRKSKWKKIKKRNYRNYRTESIVEKSYIIQVW